MLASQGGQYCVSQFLAGAPFVPGSQRKQSQIRIKIAANSGPQLDFSKQKVAAPEFAGLPGLPLAGARPPTREQLVGAVPVSVPSATPEDHLN